ncbi:putative membrane protein [Kutzneria viridogrisea]|nr:SHOCT domain-containing protein [Kutzneria albida]MBA8932030.1 putative membrane protein [Kutzneria viridogrisea]
MPWYYGSEAGWLVPLTMTLGMLLFWGGLVAVIVVVLRHRQFARRTPQEVLAERLAKGEIDEQEYQRLRDLVRG